jgi:hypothetical protein
MVGESVYEGELEPLAPLLALGGVLHVGKGTGMGLGRYTSEPLPASLRGLSLACGSKRAGAEDSEGQGGLTALPRLRLATAKRHGRGDNGPIGATVMGCTGLSDSETPKEER